MQLYCVEHDHMTNATFDEQVHSYIHSVPTFSDEPGQLWDFEYCDYPEGYFTTDPMELPKDWELHLEEPTDEELQKMDENASELMAELWVL